MSMKLGPEIFFFFPQQTSLNYTKKKKMHTYTKKLKSVRNDITPKPMLNFEEEQRPQILWVLLILK